MDGAQSASPPRNTHFVNLQNPSLPPPHEAPSLGSTDLRRRSVLPRKLMEREAGNELGSMETATSQCLKVRDTTWHVGPVSPL